LSEIKIIKRLKKYLTNYKVELIIISTMINQDINQLIERFHNFILEHDLTLQEVAASLGISYTTVAKIINHQIKKPHDRTLYKICKLIGEKP